MAETTGFSRQAEQSSGTTQNLRDVSFADVNTGTAVGYGGTILRTTDGGSHWSTQSAETTYELEGVSFTDANTGTVVGSAWNGTYVEGLILRTVDGGSHWIRQSGTDGYVNCYLKSVCFIDANTGTAVGRGHRKADGIFGDVSLRTTDGGSHWASQLIGAPYSFRGVHFADANNGLAVTGGSALFRVPGTVLRTTDGGNQWNIQYTGTNGFSAVCFADPNTATVVGGQGAILRATTGGTASIGREHNIVEVPGQFSLSQNYPNPFNPSTKIQFTIADRQLTIVKLYDLLGRDVATLVNELKQPGTYTVCVDGTNLSSGVYFCRLQAGDFVATRRLILLK